MGKYLLKKICILKASGIVFPKRGKMWHLIHHIQTQEPPVGNIYLDFLAGLPHTFDSIEILDKRNFNQHHGIHTGATIVLRIFFGNKIINEVPVNCLVYDSQKVILWNHVIHTKKLYLFSFFICFLGQNKWKYLPWFDTSIIPEKCRKVRINTRISGTWQRKIPHRSAGLCLQSEVPAFAGTFLLMYTKTKGIRFTNLAIRLVRIIQHPVMHPYPLHRYGS